MCSISSSYIAKIMKTVLGSPHSIIWTYFNLLRNLSYQTDKIKNVKEKRENNLLVILMAVTTVETFYNIYFSILVSNPNYLEYKERILGDIKNSKYPFEKKLKEWPILLFKKNIEFGKGIGQKFAKLKEIRNKLLHFLPDYKSIEITNLKIESVLDISVYEDLDKFDATNCPKEKIGHQIHIWFGDLSKLKK